MEHIEQATAAPGERRSLPTGCLMRDEKGLYCPRGCHSRCFIQDMEAGESNPIVPADADRTELSE